MKNFPNDVSLINLIYFSQFIDLSNIIAQKMLVELEPLPFTPPHPPTSPHPSPIFVLKSKNVLSYQDLKTPREPNPPGEESGATNSHNFQSE